MKGKFQFKTHAFQLDKKLRDTSGLWSTFHYYY